MPSKPPASDPPQCDLEHEGADQDEKFVAKTQVKPQHEQQMQDINNKSSPEASMTALDIEEGGGGGGGGGANGSRSVGSDDSMTDDAQIATAAAAFEPSPPAQGGAGRSSGTISAAKKPPTKGGSSRTRSSFSHKDPVQRRSSQRIAAERRAEAQKAAAAAALGAAAAAAVQGGGLVYANRSNQSRSSLRSAGSNTSTSGLSKTKSEEQSQWEESARAVVGAAALATTGASSSADAPAGSSSGLPLSTDGQSHQAAVETAPVDSMAANGGGGDDSHNKTTADGAPAKGGEGSGTTAALSDIGNAPSFRLVRVDGSTITRKTCLNTKYSLRRQLFLSFGTVSAIALMFVVLVAIITTTLAGNQVKYSS